MFRVFAPQKCSRWNLVNYSKKERKKRETGKSLSASQIFLLRGAKFVGSQKSDFSKVLSLLTMACSILLSIATALVPDALEGERKREEC